jgi:hypothetical protein
VKNKLRNNMGNNTWMITSYHLLRRNFSYLLVMKRSSPVSKSYLSRVNLSFLVSLYCMDNGLNNYMYCAT